VVDRLLRAGLAAAAVFAAGSAAAGAGIVSYQLDGKAFLYTTAKPAPSGPVRAQYPGPDGKPRCCIDVVPNGAAVKSDEPPATDELKTEKVLQYPLQAPRLPAGAAPFVGAAVFATEARPVQRSAGELALGEGPAAPRVLSCVTKEGLHVLEQADGKLQTHLYLGFDYEVKPACAKETMRLVRGGR